MWVSSHTGISLWSHFFNFIFNTTIFVEEFFWLVAEHPLFQLLQMLWFFHRHWYLVSTERSLDLQSVYYFRTCPSFWCTKNDHRPSWSCSIVILTSILLDFFDLLNTAVHSFAHSSVHSDVIFRINTRVHFICCFYEDWIPSASLKEVLYFFMRHTCKYSRVADLVSIHMKNRKNGTVCNWVQEFI